MNTKYTNSEKDITLTHRGIETKGKNKKIRCRRCDHESIKKNSRMNTESTEQFAKDNQGREKRKQNQKRETQ